MVSGIDEKFIFRGKHGCTPNYLFKKWGYPLITNFFGVSRPGRERKINFFVAKVRK